MNEKTVPAAQPPSEPSVWADIAAELFRIGEDCMALVGEPTPAMFQLNIQPGETGDGAAAAVDVVSAQMLSKLGVTAKLGGGGYYRRAEGERGPVSISIFRQVPGVLSDAREAEIARLREENARLRAAAGLDHSRDEPVDAHGGRVPPHLEDGRNPGEAVERVEVGADGCGCPVTEEIRENDSSIEGTERVEHRAGCWNQAAPC